MGLQLGRARRAASGRGPRALRRGPGSAANSRGAKGLPATVYAGRAATGGARGIVEGAYDTV